MLATTLIRCEQRMKNLVRHDWHARMLRAAIAVLALLPMQAFGQTATPSKIIVSAAEKIVLAKTFILPPRPLSGGCRRGFVHLEKAVRTAVNQIASSQGRQVAVV